MRSTLSEMSAPIVKNNLLHYVSYLAVSGMKGGVIDDLTGDVSSFCLCYGSTSRVTVFSIQYELSLLYLQYIPKIANHLYRGYRVILYALL